MIPVPETFLIEWDTDTARTCRQERDTDPELFLSSVITQSLVSSLGRRKLTNTN